jgi:hypothetical protein
MSTKSSLTPPHAVVLMTPPHAVVLTPPHAVLRDSRHSSRVGLRVILFKQVLDFIKGIIGRLYKIVRRDKIVRRGQACVRCHFYITRLPPSSKRGPNLNKLKRDPSWRRCIRDSSRWSPRSDSDPFYKAKAADWVTYSPIRCSFLRESDSLPISARDAPLLAHFTLAEVKVCSRHLLKFGSNVNKIKPDPCCRLFWRTRLSLLV